MSRHPDLTVPIEGERRFRAIFEASPDCIKRVSAEGLLLDMNAAGLRMIGADCLDAVQGRSLFDLIDPAYHRQFRDGLNTVIAGQAVHMQFEVIGLRGRRIFMDQSAAPLYANGHSGRVVEMIAVTRDVSAHRKAEADLAQARLAQDLARTAGEVAARLGQDLKAPLDTIIGYAEMLLETAQEQDRQRDADDLTEVLKAVADLRSVLNRLLHTALSDLRQSQPLAEAGDLDELIEAAVEAVRPVAEAGGNLVKVEIDARCGGVPNHRDKLGQCLRALLAHAARRTSNGLITIKARQMLAGGEPWLVLSVVDTGAGLSPEDLSTLFEAPASERDPHADSASPAACLAAARQLALFMGGDITATSAPGQGSRLTLKAPHRREQADTMVAAPLVGRQS